MPYCPRLCYITNRETLRERSPGSFLVEAVEAGIDLIQIREKDMDARALIRLASPAVDSAKRARVRVVINDRVDIALALGAAGAHLGRLSLTADVVRKIVPPDFLVGVSCHSLAEARAAESAGADYILFGPVYETPSKTAYGPPLGLGLLREAAQAAIPVLALGGITPERVKPCLAAGASGVAGIRLFQDAPSLAERVVELRALVER